MPYTVYGWGEERWGERAAGREGASKLSFFLHLHSCLYFLLSVAFLLFRSSSFRSGISAFCHLSLASMFHYHACSFAISQLLTIGVGFIFPPSLQRTHFFCIMVFTAFFFTSLLRLPFCSLSPLLESSFFPQLRNRKAAVAHKGKKKPYFIFLCLLLNAHAFLYSWLSLLSPLRSRSQH